jgi:hypothetical protein
MDKQKFRRDLIQAVAEGIAYRFDFKKKQEGWSMRDIGVYGVSATDIVDEYVLPLLYKEFPGLEGLDKDSYKSKIQSESRGRVQRKGG